MGTWGAKNLQSDCAVDILGDDSHALVTEIISLASAELATRYDEYDHTLLFVRFEQLFALNEAGLIKYFPTPEEVADLKGPFIRRWREYRDKEWPEREEIICATFDRFVSLCQAEQKRVDSLPEINVVDGCGAAEEFLADVVRKSQSVLDAFKIDIPGNWNVVTANDWNEVAEGTLLHELHEQTQLRFDVDEYKAGTWELALEQCGVATGLSLESDMVPPGFDPYVIIAKLTGRANADADAYTLTFASMKALESRFQADGEYVGGPCGGIEAEGLDFVGFQSFRHAKPDSDLRMERELHFHKLSDTEVIVLEIGGCQDNSDERKDSWLVQAIGQSLAKWY